MSHHFIGQSALQVKEYRTSNIDPTLIPDDLPGVITPVLGDLHILVSF